MTNESPIDKNRLKEKYAAQKRRNDKQMSNNCYLGAALAAASASVIAGLRVITGPSEFAAEFQKNVLGRDYVTRDDGTFLMIAAAGALVTAGLTAAGYIYQSKANRKDPSPKPK